MTLGELIKALEAEDPMWVLTHGFSSPHSYRGFYNQLAFEPEKDISIGAMLEAAKMVSEGFEMVDRRPERNRAIAGGD